MPNLNHVSEHNAYTHLTSPHVLPHLTIRVLDKGEQTTSAALAIIPPNGDWSIIRHTDPESTVINRMILKAVETQKKPLTPTNDDGEPPEIKLKRPMNAVMAYAQRRRPMISACYPNLLTAGVSRIIGYEWSSLLPKSEKDYWNDLQAKMGRAYRERYPEYDYGGAKSVTPGAGSSSHSASSANALDQLQYTPTTFLVEGSSPAALPTPFTTRQSKYPTTLSTSSSVRYDPISRPPPHIPSSSTEPHHPTPKRRKSSARTIYEPNPTVFSRTATGRFSARPLGYSPPNNTPSLETSHGYPPITPQLVLTSPNQYDPPIISGLAPTLQVSHDHPTRSSTLSPLPLIPPLATISRAAHNPYPSPTALGPPQTTPPPYFSPSQPTMSLSPTVYGQAMALDPPLHSTFPIMPLPYQGGFIPSQDAHSLPVSTSSDTAYHPNSVVDYSHDPVSAPSVESYQHTYFDYPVPADPSSLFPGEIYDTTTPSVFNQK